MRAKKDGEFVNVKVEQSLVDRLNQYVAETGFPKTVVVEKALRMYLDANESSGKGDRLTE